MLILRVTKVSGVVAVVDAMTAVIEAVLCQILGGDVNEGLRKVRRTAVHSVR